MLLGQGWIAFQNHDYSILVNIGVIINSSTPQMLVRRLLRVGILDN